MIEEQAMGGTALGHGAWLEEELESRLNGLEAEGLRRADRAMRRLPGAVVEIEGRPLADFASNDYLGLALDGRLVRAGSDAQEREGSGAGAARLISGTRPLLISH
jgi:7-keto-8-aminopelargonate synthetase-like enzyme